MPFVRLLRTIDSESEDTGRRKGRIQKPGVCYLADGVSKVDYVLVFNPHHSEGQEKREVFEEELRLSGFKLERVQSDEKRGGLVFVKISAPWGVLSTYAEVMHFKMPIKRNFAGDGNRLSPRPDSVTSSPFRELAGNERGRRMSVETVDPKQLTLSFSKTREYLFEIPEIKEDFFSAAQRSQIVNFILNRKSYSRKAPQESFDFGIERLLSDGTYLAAYPLHEGSALVEDNSARQQLLTRWGSVSSAFKPQPLDDIRRYFGVKVGLYFAWLGFYTYMLLPPAVIGAATFIYGVVTVRSYEPNLDVCSRFKDFVMCPTCDTGCEYWFLEENCTQAMLVYPFDNGATVCFTVLMALWSAAFLELWKGYSCRITYMWDLTGFDTVVEVARPAYVAKMLLSQKKQKKEGFESGELRKPSLWRRKLPRAFFTISLVFLAILLFVATAVGIFVYRLAYRLVLKLRGGEEYSSTIFVNSGAAFINMTAFFVFNSLYAKLAVKLTDLEMPRTQSEYDDSLTFKFFLLQFIGCYATTFYIAIHKNRFQGNPGKHNLILASYQQESCGSGGCFQEISTSLAVLMIGKQLFAALYESMWPRIVDSLQTLRADVADPDEESSSESSESSNPQWKMARNGAATDDEKPWERDFCLPELGRMGLFNEYLEMIIQFGFVTLFVTAMPLAPVLALISNIFEIRFRARKLLLWTRRPVGQRVKDIGVPYIIMKVVSKFSVLTNAGIIAFTSEFVPRMYYLLHYNSKKSLVGYVNFTLSYFDINHYDRNVVHYHRERLGNSSYCRYWDFRSPPWSKRPYKRTNVYWEIFVWRLLFVILFENAAVVMISVIRWLIPATPTSIQMRIREDNRLAKEMVIQRELQRRQSRMEGALSMRATVGSFTTARPSAEPAETVDVKTSNTHISRENARLDPEESA